MAKHRAVLVALLFLPLSTYLQGQQIGSGATVSINISPDDTREAPKNLHVTVLTSVGVAPVSGSIGRASA